MIGPVFRAAIATCVVGAAGVVALASVTHGFTTLTSETARRADIEKSPRAVPALMGIDQTGRRHGLFIDLDQPAMRPRVAIVDFIYTRCVMVCSVLGTRYQRLQAEIVARHLEATVRLVTVSIDPEHDTADALAGYARRMRAETRIWTLVTPTRPTQLPGLLAAFGVVVVPAPLGQFQHNAAFHLLDPTGRLTRIVDIDDPLAALDAAVALVRTTGPPA